MSPAQGFLFFWFLTILSERERERSYNVVLSVHLNDLQVLGAWGLGWEIWMDGMEITQFTYFQQVFFILCYTIPFNLCLYFLVKPKF